ALRLGPAAGEGEAVPRPGVQAGERRPPGREPQLFRPPERREGFSAAPRASRGGSRQESPLRLLRPRPRGIEAGRPLERPEPLLRLSEPEQGEAEPLPGLGQSRAVLDDFTKRARSGRVVALRAQEKASLQRLVRGDLVLGVGTGPIAVSRRRR